MESLVVLIVSEALKKGERYVTRARALGSANMSACVEFLKAAQSAIEGLERAADQILIEAEIVALYYWDDKDKKAALHESISTYLNNYKLAPLLGKAIAGITECLEYARRDTRGFFNHTTKLELANEVQVLLDTLVGYLSSLGNAMNYSVENYFGPSGINMPELLQIRQLLRPVTGDDRHHSNKIAEIVDLVQRSRVREGFRLTAEATRIIQRLSVVFQLERSSED